MIRRPVAVPVVLAGLLCLACTGQIGLGDGSSSKGTGANGSGSGHGSKADTSGQACTGTPDPGNVVMRRLTHSEYDNTLSHLLGDTSSPSKDFPQASNGATGFDNEGASLSISPLLFEKYADAAKTLVDSLMAGPNRNAVVACDLAVEGEACAEASIFAFGRKAFRRPLTDSEKQRFPPLIQLAQSEGEPIETGVKLALRAILTSPNFLYRIEFDADPSSAKAHALNGYELASRLSYFLWSSTPDEALLAAADAGNLNQAESISAQVTRMLADAKAQGFIHDFAGQWLGLRGLATQNRDVAKFPAFSEALRTSMGTETELFFQSFLSENKPFQELLTASYTFADQSLRTFYGLSAGAFGTGFGKVDFGAAPRIGLLTQASILTVTSKVTGTSPPRRGKWLLGQLLCDEPPPPPPNIPPLPQEAVPTGSVRQKFEQHRQEGCASCHAAMDPIGFAFENYDAIGSYRTLDDNGFAVDASGQLSDTQKFSNAVELASLIAQDERFPSCLTERLFVYAVGRADEDADSCALAATLSQAKAQGATLSALVTALTQSVPFTQRRGEP